jgi:hypothetical protein
MGSGAVIYLPGFIKSGSGVPKLTGGGGIHRHTHTNTNKQTHTNGRRVV